MTDRLSLYNGALAVMGERTLATLTENREPRYKLDDIWGRDFIRTILQKGQWNFATRAVRLSFSPSVSPADWGYKNGFDKPSDWVRVTGICQDEFFKIPLLNYSDEGNFLWAELDEIFVRFVSSDSTYGGDFALWSFDFTRYAEHLLAQLSARTIMGASFDMTEIDKQTKQWKKDAKATDSMKEPARFAPPTTWTRSRQQRRGDRGSRNQLIG